MMKKQILYAVCFALLPMTGKADAVDTLLQSYRQAGAGEFSGTQGEQRWHQQNPAKKNGETRACDLCHGKDLTIPGKHATTNKTIEAMAPSANPKRFTDEAKIEKWFKRNCKWTLGRECTPQEKGDFLVFLRQQ